MVRYIRLAAILALALSAACTVAPQRRGREADVPGQVVSAAVM